MMCKTWMTALIVLAVAVVAPAASNIVSPAQPGYAVEDVLTGHWISGFDFANGSAFAWAGGTLKQLDGATGALVANYGAPVYQNAAGDPLSYFNSFVRIESPTSVWVGFTTSGNADDRIYQVDLAAPAAVWTKKATLTGVQDLAFYGGAVYAVGNPTAAAFGTDATVYRLANGAPDDPNAHDGIATLGGYTAGLAMDAAGNLYYATNGTGAEKLLRFSSAQVAAAVGAGMLTAADGEVLSNLVGGAYDVDVDSAGNLLFNMNGAESLVARWSGVSGAGQNYDIVARGTAGGFHWFSMIDVEGDCSDLGGGTVYTGDFYNPGVGGVTVPEPGSLVLLAAGALAAIRRRRRHCGVAKG